MALVYVLQNGDQNLYKIGWTRGTLLKRLQQLSTGNPNLREVHTIETKCAARCENHLKQTLLSRKLIHSLAQEFYALERNEVDAAVEDARQFSDEFNTLKEELARLTATQSNGTILKPTQAAVEKYQALRKIREDIYRMTNERVRLENDLKLTIGEFDGLDGIITWRTDTTSVFDEAAFRSQHRELYESFIQVKQVRRFLLNDPSHRQAQQQY